MKFQMIQFLIALITLGSAACISYLVCQDILKKIDENKKDTDKDIKDLEDSMAQVMEMMNNINRKSDPALTVKRKKKVDEAL